MQLKQTSSRGRETSDPTDELPEDKMAADDVRDETD
jgi:hypothetical protein